MLAPAVVSLSSALLLASLSSAAPLQARATNLQTFTGGIGGAAPPITQVGQYYYSPNSGDISISYATFRLAQLGSCATQQVVCYDNLALAYACADQAELCKKIGQPVDKAPVTSLATLGLMPFTGGLGGYYAPGITYDSAKKVYNDVSYYGNTNSFSSLQSAIVDSCVNQLTACNINYDAGYACADQYSLCLITQYATPPATVAPVTSLATLGLQPFTGALGSYYAPGITYDSNKKLFSDVSYYGVNNVFVTLSAAIIDSCLNQLTACNLNVKTAYACSDQYYNCSRNQPALPSPVTLPPVVVASSSSSSAAPSASSASSSVAVSSSSAVVAVSSSSAAPAAASSSSAAVVSSSSSASVPASSSASSSAPAASSTAVITSGWAAYAPGKLVAEGTSGRALTGASFTDSAMTPLKCTAYCSARGFALAGTEYSSECYCGNGFSNGASSATFSNASPMICSGSTDVCGGPGALTVYYDTARSSSDLVVTPASSSAVPSAASSSSAPAASSTAAIASGWAAYAPGKLVAEGTTGRAFTGPALDEATMTPLRCTTFCAAQGFALAGTEYSSQCFCGNTFSNGASATTFSTATPMTCSGSSDKCGGPNALTVYYNTVYSSPSLVVTGTPSPVVPSASASAPAASSTAVITSGWAAYAPGRLVAEGINGRALTGATFDDPAMTPLKCTSYCAARGFALAGTEYSYQCFCGNGLSNSALATTFSSATPTTCSGSSDVCGGPNALTMYYNTAYSSPSLVVTGVPTSASASASSSAPAPSSTAVLSSGWAAFGGGLLAEGTDGRALNGASFESDSMTPLKCTAYCKSQGFALAGTEYSVQCFCGNGFTFGASPTKLSSATGMKCSGSADICGGPNSLTLYYDTAYATSALAVTATPPSASASASASSSAAAPASTAVVTSGWIEYKTSLLAEGTTGRAFAGPTFDDSAMTPLKCTAFCASKGYALAGTEFSYQCFCGNGFSNGASATTFSSVTGMKCSGSNDICGGPNSMTVYYDSAHVTSGLVVTSVPAATAVLTSGWAAYQPGKLVNEGNGGRALTGAALEVPNMTPIMCTAFCASQGFAIAGTEYSYQCFCGNSLQNGASATSYSSAVPTTCAGSSDTCGGPNAMSVYYNTAYSSSSLVVTGTPPSKPYPRA